jgi:hypothetical protein
MVRPCMTHRRLRDKSNPPQPNQSARPYSCLKAGPGDCSEPKEMGRLPWGAECGFGAFWKPCCQIHSSSSLTRLGLCGKEEEGKGQNSVVSQDILGWKRSL